MEKTQTYTEEFTKAVEHLLKIEGGYVNDPNDAGGETKYGISKRQYPHLNIADLTHEAAIAIYFKDYWLAYSCHKLPTVLAIFLFDSVVNHRPKTAVMFLQQSLKCSVDGIIGKETIFYATRTTNQDFLKEKLKECLAYRADFYHDLCVDKPSQERFYMGWLRRLFSLQQFILSEVNHGTD